MSDLLMKNHFNLNLIWRTKIFRCTEKFFGTKILHILKNNQKKDKTMGEFTSLVTTWIANRRTRQTIRNIEKNNELRRNITRYEPSDIEGFIERDNHVGSYIVSGGTQNYRARTAASITACSLSQNISTVILHEGNVTLQNHIGQATAFTGNKVIITNSTAVYDPFYNRSKQEICNLIMNSTDTHTFINAIGQQYILGLLDFIESKNIPPYCNMLMTCPHNTIFEKIDDAQQKGYLTDQKATSIRNELMQGQSEMANIQAFFSQLGYQGAGILSNKTGGHSVNIKTAVEHNGLIMIDIGSSTNEILLNLIVNEIKEVLITGKKMMLILDNISIHSNELLAKLIKSLSSRCLTTLVSDDVYTMLGADDNLFHSFTGNACKCVVFGHTSGVTCNKWSEIFGYYDVDKVSENIGQHRNFQWGYGFGSQYSINVSSNREFIVKPEEIARMNQNEVYIFDKNARELAYTTIR